MKDTLTQDIIFAEGEGDAYWQRNRHALTDPHRADDDPVLTMIRRYGLEPGCILECGCANGWRLEILRREFGCVAFGIEPSESAVRYAQQFYPELAVILSTITDGCRGLSDGLFDLVIVSYVFHWLDRTSLLVSIAEMDRVLAPGGYLALADFAPDYPCKVPYKHRPGLWTYKQNYPTIFTASSLYTEVAWLTYNHDTGEMEPATSRERGMVCLLRKGDYYQRCE